MFKKQKGHFVKAAFFCSIQYLFLIKDIEIGSGFIGR